MNIERVTKRLMEDEGHRGFAYDDATGLTVTAPTPDGRLTIGYGSNIQDVPMPEHISRLMLNDRILVAILDAVSVCPRFSKLDARRQEVLTEMSYQLGRSRLAGFKRMLQAIEDGRWHDAATEALDSKAARQAPKRWSRHATTLREG